VPQSRLKGIAQLTWQPYPVLIEETEIRGNGVAGSGVLFLSVWIAELRRRCELLQ
jgi:hypothetical protein